MARSDAWRHQYRSDRYARLQSLEELNQRLRDIMVNLLTLSTRGIGIRMSEIDPEAISNESSVWMEKFTHILEEFAIRCGPYPNGIDRHSLANGALPNLASDLAKLASAKLDSWRTSAGDVFIKYGKRKYMESVYESGALRIQPATYFAEASHNRAINDDELSVPLSFVATRDDLLTVVSNPDDVPRDLPHARVDVTVQLPSDYWLYCVSSALAPRLFIDYEAEACVIIRDRDRFTRMLQDASLQKLSGTDTRAGRIEYVDPLLPKSLVKAVAFTKHLRYSYQHEFRFCWLPPHNIGRAKHCDVKIGSIKEFSDLIVL